MSGGMDDVANVPAKEDSVDAVSDHEARIAALEGQIGSLQWWVHFEYIHRVIYGSQLAALYFLRLRAPLGAKLVELESFFQEHRRSSPLIGLTPFDSANVWMTWPLAMGLIRLEEDGTIGLTEKGAWFLDYLSRSGHPLSKPA